MTPTNGEESSSWKKIKWILLCALVVLIFYKQYPHFADRFLPDKIPKHVKNKSTNPTLKPFPAGSLLADHATYTFAIYHLPKPLREPKVVLKKLIAGKFNKFSFAEKPTQKALIIFNTQDINEYPPPDLESLKYFGRGLNEEEQNKLQESKKVSVLNFRSPVKENFQRLREAYEIAEILAKETGGYIWDDITRECFTLEHWRASRLEEWPETIPYLPAHVMIHYYKSGEYYREITLGMAKFGLPDIVVNNMPQYYADSIQSVINLTCQRMVENPIIEKQGVFDISIDDLLNKRLKDSLIDSLKQGAKKKGKLNIRVAAREEGDPDNRILEISFPETSKSAQELQANLIDEIFGGEDKVSYIEHDEEILAASRRSKAKLPQLQKLFSNGLQPAEHILLKAPFKTSDGGEEWMWVEVVSWNEDQIEGILVNSPVYVANLEMGSRVAFNQQDVFDYLHEFPDGHSEGNETGKILEAREKRK